MKKIVLIGLFAATLSTQAFAKESKTKCNPDGTQNEMTTCADNNYKAADKALNITWKKLIKKNKGSKSYIDKIKASQNLWIKFRDAEIAAQFACDDKNVRTCWGSMLSMLQLTALTEVTEERTKRLQFYIDTNPESALTSNYDCYLHTGSDNYQAAIQIDQNGDDITGYFARVPYEKDAAYGELKGSSVKGLIRAEYTYVMEGQVDTEEVLFRSDAKTLTEGSGELIRTKEKLVFKNSDNIQWGDVYNKTDCESIEKLISYSRVVLDMTDEQK